MMWGVGWGAAWIGWAVMVLVLAAFGAGIVLLVRGGAGWRDDDHSKARRILDERFAAGDISAEEYEARRRALSSG